MVISDCLVVAGFDSLTLPPNAGKVGHNVPVDSLGGGGAYSYS
jgi:hypothetical protein